MAVKIGGFLGVFAGWLVWHMIGGLGGFLVALFLVIPIASPLFIGLLGGFSKTSADGDKKGTTKGQAECAQCDRLFPAHVARQSAEGMVLCPGCREQQSKN